MNYTESPDDHLKSVLKALPAGNRADGYPRQTMVSVPWLRSVLSELLDKRADVIRYRLSGEDNNEGTRTNP